MVILHFLNWLVDVGVYCGDGGKEAQGKLSDGLTLREDLDKLRSVQKALSPCSSVLNANNADPEFLEKINTASSI